MTRIFTTGAEESDMNALWDYLDIRIAQNSPPSQTLIRGTFETLTVSPRTGQGYYVMSDEKVLRKDFDTDTSHTELYFGFAVQFTSLTVLPFFYVWTDAPSVFANYMGLRLTATGVIQALRTGTTIASSAVGIIATNQWYYIEMWVKPLNSNGRFVVKVDGSTVIDFTGDTTNDLELINGFELNATDQNLLTFFDDIVVNTPDGAVNNTYPGMVRLLPIRPDAPGTNSDWTRAGVDMGTDEAQLRNGTFEFSMLQTASADALQDAIPEIPDLPAGATITNIVLTAKAKVDAGAGVIAPMVIANGTSDISADQTLATNWKHYQYAWAVNPDDSAAWEEADLSLLKIGVSS